MSLKLNTSVNTYTCYSCEFVLVFVSDSYYLNNDKTRVCIALGCEQHIRLYTTRL